MRIHICTNIHIHIYIYSIYIRNHALAFTLAANGAPD